MIKIVIINDVEQNRNHIHSILSVQDDFEIAGVGKDEYDALKLTATFQPHIIIVDIKKDIVEGPELVPLIKRKSPSTAVIFLSSRDDDEYAAKALSAGALGYLVKKTDMDKLAVSIRTVYNGGYFISPVIAARTFSMLLELTRYRNNNRISLSEQNRRKPIPANINRTELQIMSFIAKGHSNKEIAESLRLKQGTVRNYLSSAMHKAGLQNRTQVAIYAIINGLIDYREI